ncbi:hypothetical protein AALM99_06835 [Lactococcus muris]|uniref:DUF4315 family protein n=1 Tax=Lactococcus muris TaxID=2941330 RepID=A0ABV4D8Y1_9LACT
MGIEEKIAARQKKIEDYLSKKQRELNKISEYESKIEQLNLEIEQLTNEEMNRSISQIDATPLEFIALVKEMKKQKLNPKDALELLKDFGETPENKDTQNINGYGA